MRWRLPPKLHSFGENSLLFFGIILTAGAILFSSLKPAPQNLTKKKEKTFDPSKVLYLSQKNVSKKFVQEIFIPFAGIETELIYGNAEIGFFRSRKCKSEGVHLRCRFLPPSYKTPIEFYRYSEKQVTKITEKKYEQPKFPLFKDVVFDLQGKFTSNFFVFTGIFYPDKGKRDKRYVYTVVLNKFTELVWAHLPSVEGRVLDKYVTVKPTLDGQLAMLFSEQDSFFEIVDMVDGVTYSLDSRYRENPYVIHHDFVYHEEQKKLLTFSNSTDYIRDFSSKSTTGKWLKSFLGRTIGEVKNTVVEIDLSTQKEREVLDPIDFLTPFDPKLASMWGTTKFDFIPHMQPRVWSFFGGKRGHLDPHHANTIQYTKEGYLVSFRNLNSVYMFSHDFKRIVWSLGANELNDYKPLDIRHAFFHQHHVSLLENGNILLVDNHPAPPAPSFIGTRILEIQRNDNGTFQVVWNYQPPKEMYSMTRGSAYKLENRNVVVFYPDSYNGFDHMLEIDYESGKPRAILKISFNAKKVNPSLKQRWQMARQGKRFFKMVHQGGGNRALPLMSLMGEDFLGYSIANAI